MKNKPVTQSVFQFRDKSSPTRPTRTAGNESTQAEDDRSLVLLHNLRLMSELRRKKAHEKRALKQANAVIGNVSMVITQTTIVRTLAHMPGSLESCCTAEKIACAYPFDSSYIDIHMPSRPAFAVPGAGLVPLDLLLQAADAHRCRSLDSFPSTAVCAYVIITCRQFKIRLKKVRTVHVHTSILHASKSIGTLRNVQLQDNHTHWEPVSEH